MMKNLLLFIVIAVVFANCQKPDTKNTENQIVIGTIDSLHSTILNETRKIWVYVPPHTSEKTKYPVLYLLDGDGHFDSVTGMIKQLSTINGNTLTPEMIVVGIPNTDRTRDLTPTHVNIVFGDSTFSKTSGGGNKFFDFIEQELFPFIEKKYPSTSYKTFVGHSLGGLMVIDALVKRPQLFTNYIAIDPSLWWDNQLLLKQADSVLSKNKYDGKSLFVAVANTMDEGMDVKNVTKDTTEVTLHIRSILQFATATDTKKDNGLHFGWKYYSDDDHGSVPLIAEYDALRFLFPWYKLKGLAKFFNPTSKATPEDLIAMITSHYENVSTHFGYTVLPPEEFINSIGYAFLSTKPDHAHSLFELNIKNYPASGNVYDSMGDSYLAKADTLKAIELFTKAIEVGSPATKEKLEKLKAGKRPGV